MELTLRWCYLPDDKMARGGGFGGSSKELLESPPMSKATSASLSRQESGKHSVSPKANRASNNISPLEDLGFLLDNNLFKANQSQRPTSAGNEPFLMGAKATPIGDPFGSPTESPASSAAHNNNTNNNNNNNHKKPQLSTGTDGNVITSPHLSSRAPSDVKPFESNDGIAAPCLVYGAYTNKSLFSRHLIIII